MKQWGERDATGDSKLLMEQLGEVASSMGSVHETFGNKKAAHDERNSIFENFTSGGDLHLNDFKNGLLHHLASSIIVKEHR